MLILMSREAKRSAGILIVVGLIIMIGHWTDMYMLVTPGCDGRAWLIRFIRSRLVPGICQYLCILGTQHVEQGSFNAKKSPLFG